MSKSRAHGRNIRAQATADGTIEVREIPQPAETEPSSSDAPPTWSEEEDEWQASET